MGVCMGAGAAVTGGQGWRGEHAMVRQRKTEGTAVTVKPTVALTLVASWQGGFALNWVTGDHIHT